MPNVEDTVAAWLQSPGVLGMRISLQSWPTTDAGFDRFRAGAYDRALQAAANHNVPLFLFATRGLWAAREIAERHPELTLIVDHIGIPQPPMDVREQKPWAALPEVLELARYPNVALKFCGAPSLATEPYPYPDIWPNIHQLVDAFGSERLMWASDIWRFNGRIGPHIELAEAQVPYPGKHTYAESVMFIRDTTELSLSEKEQILGGTVKRVLRWPIT